MPLKKTIKNTKLDFLVVIIFSLIFTFFFIKTYKNGKNINFFKYKLSINNTLALGTDTNIIFPTEEGAKNRIISALYDTMSDEIESEDRKSLYRRTSVDARGFKTYTLYSRDIITPDAFIKRIISVYPRYDHKCPTPSVFDIICETNLRSMDRFYNEKLYIDFFKNNVAYSKVKNFDFIKSSENKIIIILYDVLKDKIDFYILSTLWFFSFFIFFYLIVFFLKHQLKRTV